MLGARLLLNVSWKRCGRLVMVNGLSVAEALKLASGFF